MGILEGDILTTLDLMPLKEQQVAREILAAFELEVRACVVCSTRQLATVRARTEVGDLRAIVRPRTLSTARRHPMSDTCVLVCAVFEGYATDGRCLGDRLPAR